MSGSDYLVDTNVLIHLVNGNEAITEFLQNKEVFVSFISEMELLSKPGLSTENIKLLQSMIDNCVLVDFNHEIKSEAIKLRRNYKLKLPLLTGDKDFKKVGEIELLHLSM